MGKLGDCPGPPHLILCATGAAQKKLHNMRSPNFCSTFMPTVEPLFVPALKAVNHPANSGGLQ